ncbi:MAG: hypothetical protein V4506_17335 [Bacteroidota bacterium]
MRTILHINFYCFTAAISLLTACGKPDVAVEDKGKVIAKVNTAVLSDKELEHIVPEGLSKADSIAFLQTYINKWAYNEAFYQQATTYLSEEEQNVTRELEDFKKELISYKFQVKLINEKLDTIISNEEIEAYYNANSENFLLKNNIVKVLYVKTPISIPNFEKFKKLCYSQNPKDAEQLKALCIQYANNYYMNDNTWLMFDDLKKEMRQLNEVPEYTLQKGKTFEFSDVANFYFLRILDVKSKNTLSPLNFEKNNIKNMLINQRKQKLIDNIKKDFFEKAKTNKELEIYN